LYEHSLGIVEVEDALEVRDDDVVQAGEEANHEEEEVATLMARVSVLICRSSA